MSKIPEPPSQFTIPACYTLPQPPPPALSKIISFSDETLLYIFYALPQSALSEAASNELYTRAWRFHKELQCWITKEPEMVPTRTSTYEKGVFWVFDPTRWERERREMTVRYDDLEERAQPQQVPMLGMNVPMGMVNMNDRMMNMPTGLANVPQQMMGLTQGLNQGFAGQPQNVNAAIAALLGGQSM